MQDKRVALVTGANKGIGLQIAKDLAAHGFTVLVGSRNLEKGEAAAKSIGTDAHALQLDVTDQASIAAAAKRIRDEFGRLDVLVNNAGIYKPASLRDTDVALWDLHYRVNQLSVFLGMRAALEPMAKVGGGSIINVSSKAGMSKGPDMFAYGSSKWAVRGMSLLAAVDYAPLGIRVNAIYPGIIDTPMLAENRPEQLAIYKNMIPMKRIGTPEEVAQLVLFLASDRSGYVTGAEIGVDGGL
jgi:3alpha(or 20beta)-hydroxysteroid dehydrogenase